jgi:hypothetical protein
VSTFTSPFRCLNPECNRPIDPTDMGTLHEVTGFSQPRKRGGQNHVLFRRTTGRYLCSECAIRRRHGHEGQGSLL